MKSHIKLCVTCDQCSGTGWIENQTLRILKEKAGEKWNEMSEPEQVAYVADHATGLTICESRYQYAGRLVSMPVIKCSNCSGLGYKETMVSIEEFSNMIKSIDNGCA